MTDSEDVYPLHEAAALLRGFVAECREVGTQAPDRYIGVDGVADAVLVPVERYRQQIRMLDDYVLARRTVERLESAPAPGEGLTDADLAAALSVDNA
ncbi:hypothetical protein ACH4VR_29300 [Streptomyces sp. NPDC020883]|uniref:hypothetical protein n=1 Tax=Streptomyces sp. NPDC020883 TaxID=3365099 RepID=UPI0037AD27FF